MKRQTNLSEWIRQRRSRLGLTKKDLAVQVGVSYQTIRFWESGLQKPTAEHLKRLQEVLGAGSDQG
jgi:transcriptional regulator with XRE-family HTH domain